IEKAIINNSLSVYNFTIFTQYLLGLTLKGIYFCFNNLFISREYIYFVIYDSSFKEEDFFYTERIKFLVPVQKLIVDNKISRNEIILRRNNICNFLNASEFNLIPEDFSLIKRSENKNLNEVFDKLCFIAS